jgi:aminopeptidase
MRDQRADALARILVRYSTRVERGDVCVIQSTTVAEPLVQAVYEEVLRAGGLPVLQLSTEGATSAFYELASEEQLDFVPPTSVWAAENADVRIAVMADANARELTATDPERQARHSRARKPLMETSMRRAAAGEYRWNVTLFPTHAYASEAGMSLARYEDFYYGACLVGDDDPVTAWQRQSEEVSRLADWIQGREEVRITGPGGTDITLNVSGRTFVPCVGEHNMPDGEFFTGRSRTPRPARSPSRSRPSTAAARCRACGCASTRGASSTRQPTGERISCSRPSIPTPVHGGSASWGSGRTTGSRPPPRRSSSTRRSAAPCIWRSG